MHWTQTDKAEEIKRRMSMARTGRRQSEETKMKRSVSLKKAHREGRHKGGFTSEYVIEHNKSDRQRKAVSVAWLGRKRPEQTGEKHQNWKGESVSYSGLHKWVYRVLGRPDKCSNRECTGVGSGKIEWANLSKKYKRDLNDWASLCTSCHRRWDKQGVEPVIQ